jgi:transaldolase
VKGKYRETYFTDYGCVKDYHRRGVQYLTSAGDAFRAARCVIIEASPNEDLADHHPKGEAPVELYIDSANLKEIREAASWGILSGVTTNPTLIAREKGADFRSTIEEIATLVDGPISAETVSLDGDGMFKEGIEYAQWHPNVIIKVPSTTEGLKAVYKLAKDGIRTNVTLCFNAAQALMAARAGAFIISPFIGRVDDVGVDGMSLIREIVTIYKNGGINTKVLAASVRHPRHIIDAAIAGADVATCPFKVLQQSMKHPLTDKGIDQFLADWRSREESA